MTDTSNTTGSGRKLNTRTLALIGLGLLVLLVGGYGISQCGGGYPDVPAVCADHGPSEIEGASVIYSGSPEDGFATFRSPESTDSCLIGWKNGTMAAWDADSGKVHLCDANVTDLEPGDGLSLSGCTKVPKGKVESEMSWYRWTGLPTAEAGDEDDDEDPSPTGA